MKLPAAVLWDMDGTLVDTEPYWMATEEAIAAEHGGTWTHEDAMHLVGNDLLVSGEYIKAKLGLAQSAEEVVELLLDGVVAQVRHAVPWCAGSRELLLALHDAGVPCALVTMSYQRFVAPILEHLPPETFRVIVTGDMVDNGKPHPEPYLTAAAALGVDPGDCVAIEDSPTGATSAAAAGCTVLVVPNHVPVPPGPGRAFRDTLEGLTPTDLGALDPA
ncbi:HAD family hydrolase [Nocardioides nitrophenolicus]|uniref:HAD family hydrolase n=1 Tax=Nocardioides nitrophenolicus TaxID=60489 RepID=UPI0027DBEFEA|nr:HAD family phosphatase [Nocardioides nitrophenolicus]MBM7520450.1 HAD superfamily hydrolase (TIGR01509 family) [Nocardioides nitrophenolicus]